jgi:hypothetical protein
MSTNTDALRNIAANHGLAVCLAVCEEAADEIKDLEKAYALLFAENAKWRALAEAAPAELEAYDAGLLNDFGGGNVEWWQDYIRAELGRAHDFYQSQLGAAQSADDQTHER